MLILNQMIEDVFEKIMNRAAIVARGNKRVILSRRELKTACRLVLSPELAMDAIKYADEAHARFSTKTE